MSCCRTIQAQIQEVDQVKIGLRSCPTPNQKVHAVHRTLTVFRKIFGTYKVNSGLSSTFRREVEPDLDKVWTPEDLDNYSLRLLAFSQKVETALDKWRGKYCKEGMAATT